MGRSPVFSTCTSMVLRPELISISPGAAITSPGIMTAAPSDDGMVHGDELRAIGKCGFDLNLGNHLGNSLHDLRPRNDGGAVTHQFRNRLAVTRSLQNGGRDQSD